jgi:hypothetical protein
MDYWNPNTIPTNAPAKSYRWVSPGSQPNGFVKKHDDAVGTSNFSVRYFHRDRIRKDTGYYPDTPLSLNHALMKEPHSKGLRPSVECPPKLPQPPSFGSKTFGTPAAMGISRKVAHEASNTELGIPM